MFLLMFLVCNVNYILVFYLKVSFIWQKWNIGQTVDMLMDGVLRVVWAILYGTIDVILGFVFQTVYFLFYLLYILFILSSIIWVTMQCMSY
jgi:hypothetical protein